MGQKKNSSASRSFLVDTLVKNNVRLRLKVASLERELAHARHLAYHDPLTGLPNRALLLDRLQQAILQAQREDKAIGPAVAGSGRLQALERPTGSQRR